MMTTKHEQLDKTSLGLIPNPLKLGSALMRPNQPFVMINMLSYKQQATGDYAHLTGEEAYKLYSQSVEEVQGPLGSRMIWSGQVKQTVTEGNLPTFDTIGLLEYASPKTFLQANFKGKSNTKARSAGLNGQWLIASTTIEEGNFPDSNLEHVVLIELSGGMKHNPKARKQWHEVRQSVYQDVGTKTVWQGRADQHILGTATPEIEEVLVTWFPNPSALEIILRDPKRNMHLRSIRPYLSYTAHSIDFLPELR